MAEVAAGYDNLQVYVSDSTDRQLEKWGREMAEHVCLDGVQRSPQTCPCFTDTETDS